ncbi:hypothetical protein [Bartonella choladocola]|uniref:PemK-like, MazF-like toxin of type II toxin-antitoxin system n=1 Tax=Bartonella choladocola TaxID=2750995 RepID=A0A1U9MJA5_9HYPH|nr:hypothetical protein [Bartonella choladocola]AQT47936.1 hypothetical protein BBC0122_018390 [Bartonella choladocola]
MSYDDIRTASIIIYPYLWEHQASKGETEGRKKRPAAVAMRLLQNDLLILWPITTKEPSQDRFAVEIPDIEKRRAGLEQDLRLWIILDEFNIDKIGSSFYLEPDPPIGAFSKAFFLPLVREFIERRQQLKGIERYKG